MKKFFLSALILCALTIKSQSIVPGDNLKINHENEVKYSKYIEYKLSPTQDFKTWKDSNKLLYAKELWYYSESFYILRNYNKDGYKMDESQIDISRFENFRKETEEAIVNIPGFKDVIVLLPNNKLIYKP